MRLFIRATLLITSLIASCHAVAVTQVQTSVDRNPAIMGEYLVLTVTADDDLNAGAFNPSMLLNDFIVGRTSVGRSTKVINFDSQKETRWQVLLSPKSTGTVTIPAITIDGVSSQPIELKVMPQGTQTQEQAKLFIEAKTNVDEAYVGQLITYKVKLYLAVELQRGAINAPDVEGAQIKQIGEDVESNEIVDGKRYRVIERTYSLIADLPGEITLKGASFSGDVLVEAPRRGGMFGFNESRPMQAQADTQVINIKPIPPSFQGDWLIGDIVVLQEDWPDTEVEYEIGSPITRTITLVATSTDDTSIPDFTIEIPQTMRAYPEKPQRHTFVRQGQVVSQYQASTAIVPSQAGEFVLPEIRVPWWNARTNKQEVATLPARNITVVARASAESITTFAPAQPLETQSGWWPWLTALFAALWLITTKLWLSARNQPAQASHSQTSPREPVLAGLQALNAACKQQNVGKILLALQQHFSHLCQQNMDLAKISQLTPELGKAIAQLQAAQYSKQATTIDTQALLNAVNHFKANKTTADNEVLAPFNP